MAAYLVMKNNLKRVFHNKLMYMWMILIPVAISLIGILSLHIGDNSIRVGIIQNQKENNLSQEMITLLDSCPSIHYEFADEKTMKTELIMGTYHYIFRSDDYEGALSLVASLQTDISNLTTDAFMNNAKRIFSMLLTIYMVIATLYASHYLRDKSMGTVERFCLSGMKRASYFLGYIASTATIVGLQISVAFLFLFLSGTISTTEIGKLFLIWIFIICFTTLYGAFHAFVCKREMTAGLLSSSFAIVLSLLGGIFVEVSSMPVFLQWLSYISPIRWLSMLSLL